MVMSNAVEQNDMTARPVAGAHDPSGPASPPRGNVTHVLATPVAARAAQARERGALGIALFQAGQPELAGVGAQLLDEVRRLPDAPSVAAWDFLAIALAVIATDRLVLRRDAADGWTRVIALEVDLHDPVPWAAETGRLGAVLRFLTGDIWYLRFGSSGVAPPAVARRATDRDCVCLFSGGLDSLIGAVNLLAKGRRPLLISQASPKEGSIQAMLADELGLATHRFEGRARERYAPPYEPSSRSRSLLFISYGVLAASALVAAGGSPDVVFVPENGFISINPPLTRRRIGSLSTRTTHPFFIASLAEVLERVGLAVPLENPYRWRTKGEMLETCLNASLIERIAPRSYSCGKGKRLNQHCGRCVPCLIRRAAFHHASIVDTTSYYAADLAASVQSDDVFAARFASVAASRRGVAQWASEAGPLPDDDGARAAYVDVVRRGISELEAYLQTIAWS
jgi:hypothetical protein